ncbi:hypothetical protein HAX54_030906 [Datura stramonium]|uniref:Uncharacterized protein n=1 Tax=Datura stramonium TaxID=4076 RepID=A0ABS8V9D7_DATST|nr:hypothetical protein [Datura stramonium]
MPGPLSYLKKKEEMEVLQKCERLEDFVPSILVWLDFVQQPKDLEHIFCSSRLCLLLFQFGNFGRKAISPNSVGRLAHLTDDEIFDRLDRILFFLTMNNGAFNQDLLWNSLSSSAPTPSQENQPPWSPSNPQPPVHGLKEKHPTYTIVKSFGGGKRQGFDRFDEEGSRRGGRIRLVVRDWARALTQSLIGLNSKEKGNRLSKRIYHQS